MTTSGVGPVPAPDFGMSAGGQEKTTSVAVGARVTRAHTGQ